MSDVKVPEGMLKAAWSAMDRHAKVHGEAVGCVVGSMCSLMTGLEAALIWLDDELGKLDQIIPNDSSMTAGGYRLAIEDVRRLFLERELPSFDTPLGKFVIDSRVPPGEIRINSWNGPLFMKNVCFCTTAGPHKDCPFHGERK